MKRQIFKYAPIFKARRSYYSYVSHQGNCSVKWQKECLKKQDIKPLQSDLKWNCSSAKRRKTKQSAIALVCLQYVRHQITYTTNSCFGIVSIPDFSKKKFLGHLRWKKYSSAVSTSPKNFVRKRDLVMGRMASKRVWAGDGTLLSSLFLFIKRHISLMKFEKINF